MIAQRATLTLVLTVALGAGVVANAQRVPYALSPIYAATTVTGGNGGIGSDADCNNFSTPNGGHVGKTPSAISTVGAG